MSVSYGIINRHGGTIKVSSIAGQGTTFTVCLPLAGKTRKKSKENVTCKPQKQIKAKILVIDDEKDVRELLGDILTDSGHETAIADSGSEGLKMFQQGDFDLVFTDLVCRDVCLGGRGDKRDKRENTRCTDHWMGSTTKRF